MTRKNAFQAAALGLAALLAAGAARAEGDSPNEREREVRKERRVVVVGDGAGEGGERVFHWEGRSAPSAFLGVGLTDLTPELRSHFGAPEGAGVMVSRVEPGSPAEKAGVKVGDVIARVDGEEVASSFDIRGRLRGVEEGTQLPLEVWRAGRALTLTAAVEKRERPELDLAPMFQKVEGDRFLIKLPDGETREAPLGMAFAPERIERFRVREAELEKRLKQLEKRLQDLERQLNKQK